MPPHKDWTNYAAWREAVIEAAEREDLEIDDSDEHLEPKWKAGESPMDAVLNDGLEDA